MNEFYKPDRHTKPEQAPQSEAKTAYAEPENIRIVVDKDTPPRQDTVSEQKGSIPSYASEGQSFTTIEDIADTAKAYGERIMSEINPGGMGFNRKLKNRSISLFLCAVLGIFGAHRFYEGKIFTGILWACTGGLGLIGWIIDLIILINKPKYYEP
ncbi:MAG: TM2 domain-containing protein [Oscillospiraceae bacterium]|nr:TM2 domain-containing protein [Oscillospiraceae bacterium]